MVVEDNVSITCRSVPHTAGLTKAATCLLRVTMMSKADQLQHLTHAGSDGRELTCQPETASVPCLRQARAPR